MIANNLPRDKEVNVRLPSSRENPNSVSGLGLFFDQDVSPSTSDISAVLKSVLSQ